MRDSRLCNGKSYLNKVFRLPSGEDDIRMDLMVAEWLQRLLILQDRDSHCGSIERQLEEIPREIAREEANIKKLEAEAATHEQELKDLEVKRHDLEGEVQVCEEQIVKYKTQQMQVKKNEEYSALQHEIDMLNNKISELEDEELQLLEDIDLKQLQLADNHKAGQHDQQTLQAHILRLRENYDSFAAELEEAQEALRECEQRIDPEILKQFQYVKTQVKRPPMVVSVESGRCQGCHLKVSGEVETEVRRGTALVRCDNCGRILYYDR